MSGCCCNAALYSSSSRFSLPTPAPARNHPQYHTDCAAGGNPPGTCACINVPVLDHWRYRTVSCRVRRKLYAPRHCRTTCAARSPRHGTRGGHCRLLVIGPSNMSSFQAVNTTLSVPDPPQGRDEGQAQQQSRAGRVRGRRPPRAGRITRRRGACGWAGRRSRCGAWG